jgi:hypothetical protein
MLKASRRTSSIAKLGDRGQTSTTLSTMIRETYRVDLCNGHLIVTKRSYRWCLSRVYRLIATLCGWGRWMATGMQAGRHRGKEWARARIICTVCIAVLPVDFVQSHNRVRDHHFFDRCMAHKKVPLAIQYRTCTAQVTIPAKLQERSNSLEWHWHSAAPDQ